MEENNVEKTEETISKEEYLKLKKNNEKKKAIIVVLVFAMILMMVLLLLYYFNGKVNGDSEPTPTVTATPEPTNEPIETPIVTSKPEVTAAPTVKPVTNTSSFKYVEDNFGLASYGYAFVKGYAEVKYEVPNCGPISPCTKDNADRLDNQVFFHMLSTDSNDFKKAMEPLDDNNIPLGCIKDGIISFETGADEFGPSNYTGTEEEAFKYFMKTVSLSSDVSSKIINSNSSNPITLKISKSKLSYYMNLYDSCRTSITNLEIAN